MRSARIVTIACPRCGRLVASLAQPIHSSTATQARWAGLCRSCVTVDETARMQRDIAADVAMRIRSAA